MSSAHFSETITATRWEFPVFGESLPLSAVPQPRTAEEIDAIDAAAHEEGFARGYAEGLVAGAAEARAQAQRLGELLRHCAQPLEQLDAEVQDALVELALAAARRLVQGEFAIDPTRMAATVAEAVAALVSVPRELRVHLHPADALLLKDHLQLPPEVVNWRIAPDSELQRGDCRIAGDTGWVDATLVAREQVLTQSLLGDRDLQS